MGAAIPGCAYAAGDNSDPANALPSVTPSSTSYAATRTFLQSEDADRFDEQFYPFVVSGCTHPVPGSGYTGTLTAPCIAYPGGYRIHEAAETINYQTQGAASTDTCWVAITAAASGNEANFVRVGTTHFTVDCTSTSRPSAPTDGMILLRTTIAGGSISSVQDLRRDSPVVYYKTRTTFSSVVLALGDFAYAYDTGCLYIGNGSTAGGIVVACGGSPVSGATCPVDNGTDNHIVTWDGTDVCALKNTGIKIDDTVMSFLDGGCARFYADAGLGSDYTSICGTSMLETCNYTLPAQCPTEPDMRLGTSDGVNLVWYSTNAVSDAPYHMHVSQLTTPAAGSTIFTHVFSSDVTCPADFAGSFGRHFDGGTGPGVADNVFPIYFATAANCTTFTWTEIGSLTFEDEDIVGTFASTGEFDADDGDCLYIEQPDPLAVGTNPVTIALRCERR